MGQVSVLVSVFEETLLNQDIDYDLWHMRIMIIIIIMD